MDAKITKSRLGNFLSYEWIKILIVMAAVVGVLYIFFTMITTQPRNDQQYELYCYTGLSAGADAERFDDVFDAEIFSYDILEVQMEAFDTFNNYGMTAYAARRAAGQGEAMFVSSAPYTGTDADGNETEGDALTDFLRENLMNEGLDSEELAGFIDFPAYMNACEAYLKQIFGDNWKTNDVPDEETVREIFMARNGGDKRFRSAEKAEKGVALERARLIRLRKDYLTVSDLIARGVYSYTPYTSEAGKTYTIALNVGALAHLNRFVYYVQADEDGAQTRVSEGIHLVLFQNASDLKYESISLLRWLYEAYGA